MPAGSPDGGQWTSGGGAATSLLDAFGESVSKLPTLLLAGGFEPDDMGKTVQEFVSDKCLAGIHSVLPGQFSLNTIAEVLDMAKGGNVAARRYKKLLERDQYRK